MNVLTESRPVFALEVRAVDTYSAHRARHWLCWVLEASGVPQDTTDTALLVVSELVTNAVTHTDSRRVLVSAEVLDAGVLLVVHDDAGDWHSGLGEGADDERGRGLVLVRALATELEVDVHDAGTTVTALIPNTGSPA